MPEIRVGFDELSNALYKLDLLKNGTGYSIYPTSEFINHSKGNMNEKTNEFYKMLMDIEKELVEMVSKTAEVFDNAGIEFMETENKLKSIMESQIELRQERE